jgi:hypothetical protein
VRVRRKDWVKDIRGGVPLARSYARIITPLELVHLAHLRLTYSRADRSRVRKPAGRRRGRPVTLTSTAPNIVPAFRISGEHGDEGVDPPGDEGSLAWSRLHETSLVSRFMASLMVFREEA